MGTVYRKYICGLPMYRKHEILDKLLQNVSIRTGRQELDAILDEMHSVELETIGQIVFEGRQFNDVDFKRELAEGIIVFRLTHPQNFESQPLETA